MFPRIALIVTLSLSAMGQTSSSNAIDQPPIKKIVVEEEPEVAKTSHARNKSQAGLPVQKPAPVQEKQQGHSAPPESKQITQTAAAVENKTPIADTGKRQPDRWLRAYVILAAALTFVGVCVLVTVSRQFAEMKRVRKQSVALIQRAFELREAAEQTDRLIQQAIERSNTAAEEAHAASLAARTRTRSESFARTDGHSPENIHLARETQQLEQRAWIFVSEARVNELEIGKPLRITLGLRNTGHTLARNVQVATQVDPLPRGDAPEPKLEKAEKRGIIPPNGTLLITANGAGNRSEGLTQEGLRAIQSGEMVVWIYGTVQYEDVFETRQGTMFCYVLQPDGKTFQAADIYNDAT